MNRKRIIIVIALAAMLAIAGCSGIQDDTGQSENDEQIANDTGQDVSNTELGGSYYYEVKITEQNQQNLVREQPPFTFERSLERENLIRRYEYLNDENNVHHVYLMDEGQVVSYFVAQGKVSSVNSKLTNNQQIVRTEGCRFDTGSHQAAASEGSCYKTVESPQMDGSYGTNGDGIFFFTTSGQYVESSLDYVVSEEPRNINDEVILQEEAQVNETG